MPTQQHVIIAGGGASGVLLACHLLRADAPGLSVTLIERTTTIGRGLAFTTSQSSHLLNVRAMNMSAFGDDPQHFCRWLVSHGHADAGRVGHPLYFAPRNIYGAYIADLLTPHLSAISPGGRPRLEIVRGSAVGIARYPGGITVGLADGRRIHGNVAVLATGHDGFAESQPAFYADPWRNPAEVGVPRGAPILLLGTGLTMIDYVLSLRSNGHAGRIYAMSRRGLLPEVHREATATPLDAASIPYGQSLLAHWRLIRRLAEAAEASGGDWRSALDAVRPHSWRIWQSLPTAEKQRFLRHARAWWDVRRHRMAPQVQSEIVQAFRLGQLEVIAGKIVSVTPDEGGALVTYRRRGHRSTETLRVARIVPCTGVLTDPRTSSNPLIHDLLELGYARPDALSIGLEVTWTGALVDARGLSHDDIYAVGPLTRATFWESIAIPDIRVQCANLADTIRERLVETRQGLSHAG